MEIETKVLDILFRKISPSRILHRLQNERELINFEEDRLLFQQFCGACLGEYSLDEQSLIFSRLQSEAARLATRVQSHIVSKPTSHIAEVVQSLPSISLYTILSLSNKLLTQHGKEPMCRIEHVLSWRETFLLLGQDLFVCAFLAQEDIQSKWYRRDFTWPAVIRTNHVGLNALLQRGLAENHQHLYGSSQTLSLSWCNLMNYPESHLDIGKEFDQLYQPFFIVGNESELVTTKERVRYACLCRSHLFQWLKEKDSICNNCAIKCNQSSPSYRDTFEKDYHSPAEEVRNSLRCNKHKLWSWITEFRPDIRVANDIRFLRVLYGARVPQMDGTTACLDYALEEHIFQAAPDASYRSLAGERYFLYSCFKAFFQGEMDIRTQFVFYLYIVLKSLFRSELIQVNKKVGFRNFSDYQDRKAMLCNQSFYWAELIRMALNAPLKEGCVTSLETRLSPRDSDKNNFLLVNETDEMKNYADISYSDTQEYPPLYCQYTSEHKEHIPYFFLFHFIKRPDDDPHLLSDLELVPRHNRLRKEIRTQAVALVKALSNSDYLCRRVRGIDCASHEIGCPPEVFSSVFRFLRNYSASDYCPSRLFSVPSASQLSATFHAGEDFLDIAGALRTIDEAVTFLELHRGDRIGHALGLGIDPEAHYSMKGKRVYVRKQDRLDDLVWLLYRGRELGVHIDAHTYGKLKKEAEILLLEIYGDAIFENGWHITLTEYYCSMYLRADDPELYINTVYQSPDCFASQFDKFKCNTSIPNLEGYRRTPSLAGMYYYYHFGKREKINGSQITEIEIDAEYIELMRTAQNSLQNYLEKTGIIIECNPSSNVLIGTFGHYARHPIFRFNNTDLEHDLEKYKCCPQLQVCINTDDLGVFDTSQEFEYALLFQALVEMRALDGSPLYKEADILRYLDNIREMGHNAAFNHPSYPSSYKEQQNKQGGNKWVT